MAAGPMNSIAGDLSTVARFADAYVESRRAGRLKSLAEWAAEFPDLNDDLPRLARTLDAMEVGASPPEATALPAMIDEYRIVREIGRGGMGVVYEAEQESLGRRVAIKLLPTFGILSERVIDRFQREAQAAGRLQHQHIVPVYAAGRHQGVPYYVMQLIDGPSLEGVLAGTRPPSIAAATDPAVKAEAATVDSLGSDSSALSRGEHGMARMRAAARVALEAAEALAYAHSQGVLHRDVKPANLLIDSSGKSWLTDFGLAQVNDDAGLTGTGDVAGTLRYLAPERLWGACGPPSDVYGLGLVLYEMICGAPAFPQRERAELLRAIEGWDPPKPSSRTAGVPRDLETIVLIATAKDPTRRYASARAMAADLRNFQDHKPICARRPTWRDRVVKWCRRNPWLSAMTATAFLSLLAGGTTSTAMWLRAEEKRVEAEQRRVIADGALAQAEIEHTRAVERLTLLRKMLDGIAEKVTFMPGNPAVRAKAIEEAIDAYQAHLATAQGDAEAWSDLVHLYQRQAIVELERVEMFRVVGALANADRILENPECGMPELARLRERCICRRLECTLMRFIRDDERFAAAVDAFGVAVARLKAIDHAPEYVHNLEGMHLFELATVNSRRSQFAQAIPLFHQALRLFQTPTPDEPLAHYAANRIAYATSGLAYAHWKSGDRGTAKRTYEGLFADLEKRPETLDRLERSELAYAHKVVGMLGPPEVPRPEQRRHFETAWRQYNALRQDYGESPVWTENLAILAVLRSKNSEPDGSVSDAEHFLLEAIDAVKATRAAFPIYPKLDLREVELSSRLGEVLVQRRDYARARAYLESAIAWKRERIKTTPTEPTYYHQLAHDLVTLAGAQPPVEQGADSLARLQEAMDLESRALGLQPSLEKAKLELAYAHLETASIHLRMGRPEETLRHVGLMHDAIPDNINSRAAALRIATWCNRNSKHPLRERMRTVAVEHFRHYFLSLADPLDTARFVLKDREVGRFFGVDTPERLLAELKVDSSKSR